MLGPAEYTDWSATPASRVHDPDGNEVELYIDTSDSSKRVLTETL